MSEKLRHYDSYNTDLFQEGHLGIGMSTIDSRTPAHVFVDQQTGIVMGLYGDIYDVQDNEVWGIKDTIHKEKTICGLYKKYGVALPERLNGDFNIVLYDPNLKKIVVCNDRLGFKPLYIYTDKTAFLFSPEIKGFLAYPGFIKDVDEHGVADYFNYSYHMGEKTMFKHVKLLTPATCIVIGNGVIKSHTYWKPKYTDTLTREDLPYCIETGYEGFMKSVQRRTAGSKKMLIPLSGGLDSRFIAAAAKGLGAEVRTATFGSKGCLEHEIAKKVCSVLGIDEPRLVVIRPDWIKEYGQEFSWLTEAGHSSLDMTTQFGFRDEMGTNYDCFLNGIFGGHITFGSPYFTESSLNASDLDDEQKNRLFRGLNGERYDRFAAGCATKNLNETVHAYRYRTLIEEWEKTATVSDKFHFRWDYFFIYNRIRRGMNVIDQNKFFYNDQHPFASYELFDLYLGLSPDMMLQHYLYKELYKKKLPELASIPWQNTKVNLYENPSTIQKNIDFIKDKFRWYSVKISRGRIEFLDKSGFAHYSDSFYRKSIAVREWFKKILLSDECLGRGYFNKEGLTRLMGKQEKGGPAFEELSKMVVFELWARRFLN